MFGIRNLHPKHKMFQNVATVMNRITIVFDEHNTMLAGLENCQYVASVLH